MKKLFIMLFLIIVPIVANAQFSEDYKEFRLGDTYVLRPPKLPSPISRSSRSFDHYAYYTDAGGGAFVVSRVDGFIMDSEERAGVLVFILRHKTELEEKYDIIIQSTNAFPIYIYDRKIDERNKAEDRARKLNEKNEREKRLKTLDNIL